MQHILLIGNPNVGKSTLIGALGGQNAKTANISGVTAGSSEHKVSFQGQDLCVVDLPGCYALDSGPSGIKECSRRTGPVPRSHGGVRRRRHRTGTIARHARGSAFDGPKRVGALQPL